MLVTYKGSQPAMHIYVKGRYFRLVPSQPVKLTHAQAEELQARRLMQVLVNADEIEFSEQAISESDAVQADEGLKSEPIIEPEQTPEVTPTTEPEPAIDAVADDVVVSDAQPEQSNDVAVVEPDVTPEVVDAEVVIEPETAETVEPDIAPEAAIEVQAKPVSKMTVKELETYITDNGGSYTSGDNKPELLTIAQDIENAKQ